MTMMPRKKRKRDLSKSDAKRGISSPKRIQFNIVIVALLGLAVVCFGAVIVPRRNSRVSPVVVKAPVPAMESNAIPLLDDLLAMSADQINQQDLAMLNLVCANGLPGTEPLDIRACLTKLDNWTKRVKSETSRNINRFYANPDEFDRSESVYRVMMLVTVLQQDFGVHYNLNSVDSFDFRNSKDLFVHGMLEGDNGGTCVSMPALYTIIGKRLGYPMFLVNAKEHMFCRWDSPHERFNIEGTSQGLNVYDDAHYRAWPRPISDAEVKKGYLMKSLTNAESFAAFLAARGHFFNDNRLRVSARKNYLAAMKFEPGQPMYAWFVKTTPRGLRMEDFPELVEQDAKLRREYRERMSPEWIMANPRGTTGFSSAVPSIDNPFLLPNNDAL